MHQRSRSAVLAVVLSGALAMPIGAAGAAPATNLVGTYQVVSIDNAPSSRVHGREDHVLVTDSGRVVPLALGRGTRVKPGSRVRVSGRKLGRTVNVSAMSSLTTSASGSSTRGFAANNSTGTTSVLAILASWTAPDSVTQASANQVLFGNGNPWWAEASYGRLAQTGVVTPWVNITAPSASICTIEGMSSLQSKAEAAARSAGYDAAAYERTIVYIPRGASSGWADCAGVAGVAFVGGDLSILNGYMTMGVALHEQGHNYGLEHAQAFACTSGAAGGTCTVPAQGGQYGDPHDPMGHSDHSHFSAAHKDQLGWLGARAVALGADSSVRLTPLATVGGSGTVAAHVTVGARKYWFEYRQKINQDAALHSGAVGGVLVHLVDPNIAMNRVGLLDMTPDGSWDTAVLANGASWRAPEGFNISVSAAGSTGVTLTRTDTVVARKATSLVSSTTSVTLVTYPTTAKLQTRLMSGVTPLVGKSAALYVRKRGTTSWSYVRSVTTKTDGWAATLHSPLWHADYQWRFAGDPAYHASTARTVALGSRVRVTAKLDRTTMTRGSTAKLTGTVGPAHSGTKVYLQRYYGGTWSTVATLTLGTSTAFGVNLRMGTPTTYRFRMYMPTHTDHYSGLSATLTLKVT